MRAIFRRLKNFILMKNSSEYSAAMDKRLLEKQYRDRGYSQSEAKRLVSKQKN